MYFCCILQVQYTYFDVKNDILKILDFNFNFSVLFITFKVNIFDKCVITNIFKYF